jgi:hypothetical protein
VLVFLVLTFAVCTVEDETGAVTLRNYLESIHICYVKANALLFRGFVCYQSDLMGGRINAHTTKAHTKIPHRKNPTVINAHMKNTHTDKDCRNLL